MSRIDDLTRHIADNYLVRINAAFGQTGVDVVKEIHPHLRRIYAAVAYESLSGGITVYRVFDRGREPVDRKTAIRLFDFTEITAHHKGTLTVEIVSDSEIYVWLSEVDLGELGDGVLAYTFSDSDGEQFWLNGMRVGDRTPARYPLFGLHLFHGVEEALRRYARDVAYGCHCDILGALWREPERLVWVPAPENRLRDSLAYFLKNALADGVPDVVKESPVDDRNPVDITVRWADSNRMALIEVKWLGSSGHVGGRKFTKTWRADRATKGLRQIANYIDINRARARLFEARGYLVLFDGRRARLGPQTPSISRADAFFYEHNEPPYESDILGRHDIAEPVRCFCSPNLSVSSPSAGKYTH